MNVNLMRLIDQYLGIPVCFILTIWNRIIRLFGFDRKHPEKTQKILFLQISEMGSAISAYSSLVKTKELYPNAEIYYFIFREMQASVKLLDIIPEKNIYTVTSKSFFKMIFGIMKVSWIMRRKKIDVILDLELFSRMSSILSYLFGGKSRVGFNRFHMEGLYRGDLQTHKVLYNHLLHISQNFLSLLYAVSEQPDVLPHSKRKINSSDIVCKKISSSLEQQDTIFKKLQSINPDLSKDKEIILLNPNASDLLPLRKWPIENYIELTRLILDNPNAYIIITGVKSEKNYAQSICDSVQSSRCINFAGETTLDELIDLYNISHMLISNDSGPPNFASLTNIKVLVFFGPESPICYKPLGDNIEALYADFLCSPCVSAYNHRKSACTDNQCLKAITPKDVHHRVLSLLEK